MTIPTSESRAAAAALANAWSTVAAAAAFQVDYDGEPTADAHAALERMEEEMREYIIATGDMRLSGLLQVLGHACLRMEQVLWPDEYERIRQEIEEGLRDANGDSGTDRETT